MFKFVKKILHNEMVDRDLIMLLFIGGLYSLGTFLSNTFVNVYLWRQTNDFFVIAMYNLAVIILQPLTFIVAGRLAKKVDRIIVLRLGVIFMSIFYLTVLIIGDAAATLYLLLGCLLGIGYGFYWLAFNVLTFEITEPETRDFFNGFLGGLESLGGMIGPLLAGWMIAKLPTEIGYTTIFSVSLSLFIMAVISSFFLKRRKASGKFELKKVFSEIKTNRNWKYVTYAHIFQGIREGIFMFVISIWVFLMTNSEFALGIFNLTLNVMSFIFYILMTKILNEAKRKKAILIGGMIISFSVYIILFDLSFIHLVIYATVIGIGYPIINVAYNSMTYDVIGTNKYAKTLRIEYVVTLEVFVNIGRFISVCIFIIAITLFSSEKAIPYLLWLFSHAYLLIYIYLRNVQVSLQRS